MERELIAFARGANFKLDPENERPGGEGIKEDADAYWVCVVVA